MLLYKLISFETDILSRNTIIATIISPAVTSDLPTTAASKICGCDNISRSISNADNLKPEFYDNKINIE